MQEMNLDNSTQAAAPTVAVAADLMFAGRIRGTAETAGTSVRIARSAGDVVDAVRAGARLVLLDLDARALDAPALIRTLRSDDETRLAHIVAFVAHTRADAIQAARDAGADRVLARSAFVRELPALLAPMAHG